MWQVELQQYHFKLYHKPGENNKANALSHCLDYNMGNPTNDHLIILLRSCFVGMPPNILASFDLHMESPLHETYPNNITLVVARLKDEGTLEANLNNYAKLLQEECYELLHAWLEPHHLQINTNNHFWKDDALIIVENNNLKRG